MNSQRTSPLMDGGVDEEAAAAAAALLMVVDVIEELTRVSSRVAKRKKKNLCHQCWKEPEACSDDCDGFDSLESRR